MLNIYEFISVLLLSLCNFYFKLKSANEVPNNQLSEVSGRTKEIFQFIHQDTILGQAAYLYVKNDKFINADVVSCRTDCLVLRIGFLKNATFQK